MAKTRHNRRRPRSGEDHFEGQSAEELARELGLDELSLDSCVRSLFAELLDDVDLGEQTHANAESAPTVYRVIQTGPGRRDKPSETPGSDDER